MPHLRTSYQDIHDIPQYGWFVLQVLVGKFPNAITKNASAPGKSRRRPQWWEDQALHGEEERRPAGLPTTASKVHRAFRRPVAWWLGRFLWIERSYLVRNMGMDQYLLIPFLVGWTSIYQLFWCSPGVLLVLTHCLIFSLVLVFHLISFNQMWEKNDSRRVVFWSKHVMIWGWVKTLVPSEPQNSW